MVNGIGSHLNSCGVQLGIRYPIPPLFDNPQPNRRNMSSHKIRAVAFDLDGTMFNTEDLYWQVGVELLDRRGCVLTRELVDQMMGRPGEVAYQIMIDHHKLDDSITDLQRETDEIFEDVLPGQLEPMPGLIELLDTVDKLGLPKAITTSSRRSFVDRVMGISQLGDRFDFFLTSESVQQGKPHPEIYLTAARTFAVPTLSMMVLEDSQTGCRAAVDAGAFVVAIPAEHSRGHDYSGSQFLAESLNDPRIMAALNELLN